MVLAFLFPCGTQTRRIGILWSLYGFCCFATFFFFWLVFGLVVEPERFISLVSGIVSFLLAVGGRLYSLVKWRRFVSQATWPILGPFGRFSSCQKVGLWEHCWDVFYHFAHSFARGIHEGAASRNMYCTSMC